MLHQLLDIDFRPKYLKIAKNPLQQQVQRQFSSRLGHSTRWVFFTAFFSPSHETLFSV
jgi:hypothetical protein